MVKYLQSLTLPIYNSEMKNIVFYKHDGGL